MIDNAIGSQSRYFVAAMMVKTADRGEFRIAVGSAPQPAV